VPTRPLLARIGPSVVCARKREDFTVAYLLSCRVGHTPPHGFHVTMMGGGSGGSCVDAITPSVARIGPSLGCVQIREDIRRRAQGEISSRVGHTPPHGVHVPMLGGDDKVQETRHHTRLRIAYTNYYMWRDKTWPLQVSVKFGGSSS